MITLDKSFLELVIPLREFPGKISPNFLLQIDKEMHLVIDLSKSDITKVSHLILPEDVLNKVIGLRLLNADSIQHIAAVYLWNGFITKISNIRHLNFKGNHNGKVGQLSTLIEKYGSGLETLKFMNVEMEDCQVPVMFSLRKLIIYECSGNEMQILEKVSQDLEHFEILPCGLSQVDLNITLHRFKTLNFLSLFQGEDYNSEILDVPNILQKCGESLRLRKLTLHGVDLSGMSTKYRYNLYIKNLYVDNIQGNSGLMHFISENSPTLRVLVFNAGTQNELDFKLITGIFSHLKYIVLSGSPRICCVVRNLSSMINKCLYIEELGIENVHVDCDSGLQALNIKSLDINVPDDSISLCPGFFQLIQAGIDHITDLKIIGKLDPLVNLSGKFKCLNKLVIKENMSTDGKLGLKKLLDSCSDTIQFLELMHFEDVGSIVEYELSFPKLRHISRLNNRMEPEEHFEALFCMYFGVDFDHENFSASQFMDPQLEQMKILFGENQEVGIFFLIIKNAVARSSYKIIIRRVPPRPPPPLYSSHLIKNKFLGSYKL